MQDIYIIKDEQLKKNVFIGSPGGQRNSFAEDPQTRMETIREVNPMKKKLILGIAALFLFTGCAAFESLEVKEQKYGKAAPVIEQSFASKAMKRGDTWRIYLKASDPDGDMKTIVAYLEGVAMGGTRSISHTRIKENDRKEISGYLYWYPGPDRYAGPEMVMTIQIQDMAGHFSNPVSLPLRMQFSGSQESPPQGVFQEKDLGPVMITLQPKSGMGGP